MELLPKVSPKVSFFPDFEQVILLGLCLSCVISDSHIFSEQFTARCQPTALACHRHSHLARSRALPARAASSLTHLHTRRHLLLVALLAAAAWLAVLYPYVGGQGTESVGERESSIGEKKKGGGATGANRLFLWYLTVLG